MQNLSFGVLRHRDFRLLLVTRMFITMTLQAQAVIVGWQVYSITKSPLMLGLTGLAEAVPAILGALVAGHVVDNSVPLRVYRLCVGTMFLNTVLFYIFAGGMVAAPGGLLPWMFAGVVLSGVARSFNIPAAFTMVSRTVPKAEMPPATAWLSSAFQVAAVTGPAAAGLVYGGYGPHGAWLLPLVLIALAFFLSLFVRMPAHKSAGEKREKAVDSIRAGWRFILKSPVLLSVMTLDMFAVLFGGAVAMLPAYADQVLHVGSEGLGALRAAPALGAIITSVFLAVRPLRRLSGKVMLWTVAGFGVSILAFGLSTSFPLSIAALAFSGAFDSVSVVTRSTLMQLLTPDAMRGRVSSINSMFIISSNEIGAFESGLAAQMIGLVPSVAAGGVATLIVVAVIALAAPKFRKTVIDTRGAAA